jgi:hypothetical protein
VREIEGNLWQVEADYRVVPTNGVYHRRGDKHLLVMGAGVAKEAADRYPEVPHLLGSLVKFHGNLAQLLAAQRLISWPTKNDWRQPSDLGLIVRNASRVVRLVEAAEARVVALPRLGCGLGGLRWEDVREVLAPLLDDRFVVVTPTEMTRAAA